MAIGVDAWLREVVTGVVPEDKRESLWALKRSALRIVPGSGVGVRTPGSRLGGQPLGAVGTRWPVSKNGPLDLLAQLDLAEIARIWPEGPLPDHGLLSFFYDTPPWASTSPSDSDKWQVRWERDAVQPLPLPEGGDTSSFPSRSIQWEPVTTLPRANEDDCVFQDCGLLRELAAVDDAVGNDGAFHQLLGWPHLLQGSITTTCQEQSAFAWEGLEQYAPGRSLTREDWDALDDATRASDWRLLLQLGTDADGPWCWGDGGGLYFCIRAQDLDAARFDRVWTVMQC